MRNELFWAMQPMSFFKDIDSNHAYVLMTNHVHVLQV